MEAEYGGLGRGRRRDVDVVIIHIVEGTSLPAGKLKDRGRHWEEVEGEESKAGM